VPPDFGGLLPKRKRHWHDLDLAVIEQYGEGMSYRAIQRCLRRRTVFVGLACPAPDSGETRLGWFWFGLADYSEGLIDTLFPGLARSASRAAQPSAQRIVDP